MAKKLKKGKHISSDDVVRVPVLPRTSSGNNRMKVSVGKVDKEKLIASRGGRSRTAFGSDPRTSFVGGSGSTSGIPPELLSGVEDFSTLYMMMRPPRERYDLYRYFWRSHPFVGRAINLLTQLPISKIRLDKPKGVDNKLAHQILKSMQKWAKRVKLSKMIYTTQLEKNVIGDAWVFCEWNEEKKEWGSIAVLPPEMINPTPCQFSDKTVVEFSPDPKDVELIKQAEQFGIENLENEEDKRRIKEIPNEIKKLVLEDEKIYLGTDPYEGSFIYQMSRDKLFYESNGISIVERVLVPLLTHERFRNTQLGQASRNMTPKHVVSVDGASPDEVEALREEIDLSFINPEYPIVVNYPVDYQLVGAQDRLLDLSSETEALENQYMAGLGVTRELLVGEGIYAGNRITVEVINTMFTLDREEWQDFVEEMLFKPMALARGWVQYPEEIMDLSILDRSGVDLFGVDLPPDEFVEVTEEPVIPSLRFNRVTLRDNAEIFDSLFQLYQKGSIPVDYILDLFNIDSEDVHEQLVHQMFTVKDSTWNDFVRDMYGDLSEQTIALAGPALAKKLAESMGVQVMGPDAENEINEEEMVDFGERFGSNKMGNGGLLENNGIFEGRNRKTLSKRKERTRSGYGSLALN